MNKKIIIFVICICSLIIGPSNILFARGHGGGGGRGAHSYHSNSSHVKSYSSKSYTKSVINKVKCSSCKRDSNGKISRSESAVLKFKKQTGYPNGRPGYVVDHKIPLYKGGTDDPSNMQWLTVQQHHQKHHHL